MNDGKSQEPNEVIDFSHLDLFTRGRIDVEEDLLGNFVAGAETYVKLLQAAPDEKQWRDAAHALKGAARGIGAKQVGELAEAAEQVPVSDSAGRAAALARLSEALAAVRAVAAARRRTDDR